MEGALRPPFTLGLDDVFQARDLLLHLPRERKIVELRIGAADDVKAGRRMPREVPDFLFAVRRERANRNKLSLYARDDGVDHLVAVR